jgi:presenilin-like A22 family membrane protease
MSARKEHVKYMFLHDLKVPNLLVENSDVSVESSSVTITERGVVIRVTLNLLPSEDAKAGWPYVNGTVETKGGN